jgi:hypothetical protein
MIEHHYGTLLPRTRSRSAGSGRLLELDRSIRPYRLGVRYLSRLGILDRLARVRRFGRVLRFGPFSRFAW